MTDSTLPQTVTSPRYVSCDRCHRAVSLRLTQEAANEWLRDHQRYCDPCGQCGEQMGRMTPEARMAHELMHLRETTEAIARDLAELRSLLGVRDA